MIRARQPMTPNSKARKPFAVGTGNGGSVAVGVLASDAAQGAALLRMRDGNSVAMVGSVAVQPLWQWKDWQGAPGADCLQRQPKTKRHGTDGSGCLMGGMVRTGHPPRSGSLTLFLPYG